MLIACDTHNWGIVAFMCVCGLVVPWCAVYTAYVCGTARRGVCICVHMWGVYAWYVYAVGIGCEYMGIFFVGFWREWGGTPCVQGRDYYIYDFFHSEKNNFKESPFYSCPHRNLVLS